MLLICEGFMRTLLLLYMCVCTSWFLYSLLRDFDDACFHCTTPQRDKVATFSFPTCGQMIEYSTSHRNKPLVYELRFCIKCGQCHGQHWTVNCYLPRCSPDTHIFLFLLNITLNNYYYSQCCNYAIPGEQYLTQSAVILPIS